MEDLYPMYGYPSYIHRDIPYISTVAGLMMLFAALLSFLYRLDFGNVGFWLIWALVFFATTMVSQIILYQTYEL
jgi:hypothetical protein